MAALFTAEMRDEGAVANPLGRIKHENGPTWHRWLPIIEDNNSGARKRNKATFSISHLKVFKASGKGVRTESSGTYFYFNNVVRWENNNVSQVIHF